MNRQKALSLLILGLFIFSMLGVVAYAVEPYYEEELSLFEKWFGDKEKAVEPEIDLSKVPEGTQSVN